MRSPLLQMLMDEHQYPLLTEDSVDAFLASHDDVVLFFTENPKHFPESNDVAVILPELMTQFAGRLTAAVIEAEAERPLYQRYAFTTWPALVFMRRGEYVGVITGMQNWSEFMHQIETLLATPGSRPPSVSIPVRLEPGRGCGS